MSAPVMNTVIASRDFVVDASRERVWRLIGKVILGSLPGMEEIEILDENNFRAFLRVKILLLELRMRLKGEIVDMVPPDSLGVNIFVEAPGGLVKMSQKVTLAMTSIDRGKTSVACQAGTERLGILSRWILIPQARRFAQSVFETIETRLRDLA
jgi:carbon monoxide dehydrogenase subunit G